MQELRPHKRGNDHADRVAHLQDYLERLNRSQGLGFVMFSFVINKHSLLGSVLTIITLAFTLATVMVGLSSKSDTAGVPEVPECLSHNLTIAQQEALIVLRQAFNHSACAFTSRLGPDGFFTGAEACP